MSNAANNEAALDDVKKLPAGLGAVPANMASQLKKVDLMEEIPTVVPGKPGFEIGATLAGKYLRTERVYSNKFKAGKKDEAGRKYRDLHVFVDAKGLMFGIWSVGILGYTLSRVKPETYLAITYDGVADESIKEGDNAPHTFTFAGIDIDRNIIGKNVISAAETSANAN